MGLNIYFVIYFDDLGEIYFWVMKLLVIFISLDLIWGKNLELIKSYGFLVDKILGVGVVDV